MGKSPVDPARLIVKLLALALDQDGMPEGKLARHKAEKLIAKHGIKQEDIADFEAWSLVKEEAIFIPAEGWALDLLSSVSYFCASATYRRKPGEVIIFGRSFHIDIAILFYQQVLRQLDNTIRSIEGAGLWDAEEINNWRASFVLGVGAKLHKMRAEHDPFENMRDACVKAAIHVLDSRFPQNKMIPNYSKTREQVDSAFEVGANIDMRQGISASTGRFIGDGSG